MNVRVYERVCMYLAHSIRIAISHVDSLVIRYAFP